MLLPVTSRESRQHGHGCDRLRSAGSTTRRHDPAGRPGDCLCLYGLHISRRDGCDPVERDTRTKPHPSRRCGAGNLPVSSCPRRHPCRLLAATASLPAPPLAIHCVGAPRALKPHWSLRYRASSRSGRRAGGGADGRSGGRRLLGRVLGEAFSAGAASPAANMGWEIAQGKCPLRSAEVCTVPPRFMLGGGRAAASVGSRRDVTALELAARSSLFEGSGSARRLVQGCD